MKKTFSIALLISLLTATQAAFAMEAEGHDEDKTNQFIADLKKVHGMKDMLSTIGKLAYENARQTQPETLNPELHQYLLKFTAAHLISITHPEEKELSHHEIDTVTTQSDTNTFSWTIHFGGYYSKGHYSPTGWSNGVMPCNLGLCRSYRIYRPLPYRHLWRIADRRFCHQHIALLNDIWKAHKKNLKYELNEIDTKKLNLLPEFIQKAMTNLSTRETDWDSTIPYACTLL